MTFEEIKIAKILLEELKDLSKKGEVFDKSNIPNVGDENSFFKILPFASIILNHLGPYVAEVESMAIDTVNMTPFNLNQLICNLEKFLSVFDKEIGTSFKKGDVFEFRKITEDISRLVITRDGKRINFDGAESFDFHLYRMNDLAQDIFWFFTKFFKLNFRVIKESLEVQEFEIR